MAATTTATVNSTITLAQNSGDGFPSLTPSATHKPAQQSYTAGTNAGQIDVPYAARLTIVSGSPQSLDLSGGSMKTLLGAAANFARGNTIAFHNRGSNIVTLTGNLLNSIFGNTFSYGLKPNGRFLVDDPSATGMAVTNSTADTITLTGAAGSTDVDVAIGGRSV